MRAGKVAILFTVVVLLYACEGVFDRGDHTRLLTRTDGGITHKSAEIRNDSVRLKLAYAGKIELNRDRTEIISISPEGYYDYKKNRNTLLAKPTKDGIALKITRDDEPIDPSSSTGKKVIAAAIKDLSYTDSLRGIRHR